MNNIKKWLWAGVFLAACIGIRVYSHYGTLVENGYSTRFFPRFSAIQRMFFGKIPFCLGDILYLLLFLWLSILLFRFLKSVIIQKRKPKMGNILGKLFFISATVYIIFNIFWGLNYNRKGINWQLGLPDTAAFNTEDLRNLNCLLLDKINQSKLALMKQEKYPTNRRLFQIVNEAYQSAAEKFPFLKYAPVSLKPGLWGNLQSYSGISGYYNPFTGEAQINTHLPSFILPYTACHEVAHQIGYAKEMEANIVGYLAAVSSKDTLLHYSAYIDLFMYANTNLSMYDPVFAYICRKDLLPQVKADYKEWKNFRLAHQSFMNPVINVVYGNFLKQNQQPLGMQSYNAVTGFLINWNKKQGKI